MIQVQCVINIVYVNVLVNRPVCYVSLIGVIDAINTIHMCVAWSLNIIQQEDNFLSKQLELVKK